MHSGPFRHPAANRSLSSAAFCCLHFSESLRAAPYWIVDPLRNYRFVAAQSVGVRSATSYVLDRLKRF